MVRSASVLTLVILVAATAVSAQSPPSMPGMPSMPAGPIMVTPDQIKWMDGPPSFAPGLKMAMLQGNMAQAGPYAVRLQFPANYKVPAHFHPNMEHVTVISGTFYFGLGNKLNEAEGKPYPPGSFVAVPPNTPHFAYAKEETVVQVHSTGPGGLTYVDPADDPRKK